MIKGENIVLRALEPEDLELLYQWENNIDVWQISNTVTPFSKYILKQYLENQSDDIFTAKQLRLVIEVDFKPIGTIDLFDYDPINHRAGVGVLIASQSDRNKGYATESLALLKEYAFNKLQLNQLYCNILEDNQNSIRLFENLGFEKVGLKKDWIKNGNRYLDEYLFQCIKA